ncbi:MAG: hypothetical protein ACRD4S_07355 [Candidatus Acidiferrales bacterium]
MQQHLGRQDGVEKVEVSLLKGTADITPKDDGKIDPAHLLKATYDSGVTVAEMDMTASGRIVKDAAGEIALQVEPNQSFAIEPNDLSKGLEAMAGTGTEVTVRAQLFKKPEKKAKKKKAAVPASLKIVILEVLSQ